MKIKLKPESPVGMRAFSLIEVMIAAMIIGVVFVSLFVGIGQGFGVIQVSRENLRATQIMQEQVEILRILNWNQITTNASPWSYQASFFPANLTNQGVIYYGQINLTNAPVSVSATCAADVRLAIISLSWTNGKVARQRELRTLVSRYGLHNYFLNP